MDGTGELFGSLVEVLPEGVVATIVQYPRAEELDWEGLLKLVESSVPIGEAYSVVAESFSGPIAMRFAAAQPQGLQSLVLCATFCRNPLAKGLRWVARLASPTIFKRRPPGTFVRRYLVDSSSSEILVKSVQHAVAQVSPGVLAHRVRLVNESNADAELGKVEVPVLYLEGSRDRIVGGRGWVQVNAVLPSAEYELLDGPHLLLQCVPKSASVAILSFLERHRYEPAKPMNTLAINTACLRLDGLREGDAKAFFAYRSLAEVVRFQSFEPVVVGDAVEFIQRCSAVEFGVADTWAQWAVRLKESGELVGDVGVHFLEEGARQVEIGFTVAPDHQGQGLGSEAVLGVLGYLFEDLEKHRIVATVDPRNLASMALLKRVGMRQEAHFVESLRFKGEWVDDVVWGILKSDWLRQKRLHS